MMQTCGVSRNTASAPSLTVLSASVFRGRKQALYLNRLYNIRLVLFAIHSFIIIAIRAVNNGTAQYSATHRG